MPFERIRERRQQLNLTQQQLAALTGIEQRTLSRIEGTEGNPTAGNLIRLAQALTCSIDWLLELSDIGPDDVPDELSPIEHEILTLVRSKALDRQQKILEMLRLLE